MPYKIFSVSLDSDEQAATAIEIPDCVNMSMSNNPQLERIITAGETQPKHVSLVSQKATASFDTYALPTTLAEIGASFQDILTAGANPGVVFFLQKFDAAGNVSAGSVHRSLTISSGVVVPRRLTCDHQGHAMLSVDVVIVKESANNAIVIADNVAMPTLANQGLRWTLDGMTVGGVALTDYTSMEIDFGNTVETRGTQSDVWDAYVEVRTHAPTITLTGIDPAWFATAAVPIDGLACTIANTILYLRKRAVDGTGFVIDGTAEHVKITAGGVATIQNPVTGSAQAFTESSIVITCMELGGNNPLIFNTASAIT